MGVCVFQNIHISQQRLQMVSSKAHVQLTPFSLQESLVLHKNSLGANTTQMMNSRLETELRWVIFWDDGEAPDTKISSMFTSRRGL